MITTYDALSPLVVPRPGYLATLNDTVFDTYQIRVTGNFNTGIPVIGGEWHKPWSRHRYSKRQPWNHDATKLLIDQKSGGSPSRLVLDAATYTPLFGANDLNGRGTQIRQASELQWRPGNANQMVSTRFSGTGTSQVLIIEVFDISTTAGTSVGTVSVPTPSHSSIAKSGKQGDPFGWIGEGQISDDGRWTVVCSCFEHPQKHVDDADYKDYAVLVDLDNFLAGAAYDLSYCTMGDAANDIPMWATAASGEIGNPGISTQGNYAQIHLKGTGGGNSAIPVGREYAYILDVNKTTRALSRRVMDEQAMKMLPEHSAAEAAAIGMIPWLSHSDFNEDSAGNEVIVGGGRGFEFVVTASGGESGPVANYGKKYGTALMINLSTGVHKYVAPGDVQLGRRCAAFQHGSGRAYQRRGWHLVSWDSASTGLWGAGEVMWIRLLATNTPSGTRSIERLCVHHSDERSIPSTGRTTEGGYNAEAHPVACPDGSKAMFASNWQLNASAFSSGSPFYYDPGPGEGDYGLGPPGLSSPDDCKAYVVYSSDPGIPEPEQDVLPVVEAQPTVGPYTVGTSASYSVRDERTGQEVPLEEVLDMMNTHWLETGTDSLYPVCEITEWQLQLTEPASITDEVEFTITNTGEAELVVVAPASDTYFDVAISDSTIAVDGTATITFTVTEVPPIAVYLFTFTTNEYGMPSRLLSISYGI